jgi:hypothetical protein
MNHSKYQHCIEACHACVAACEHCSSACLREADVASLTRCIELDRTCAYISAFAANVMSRSGVFVEPIAELCAEICDACAEECGTHDMDHCRRCAEACRRCAEACRKTAVIPRSEAAVRLVHRRAARARVVTSSSRLRK